MTSRSPGTGKGFNFTFHDQFFVLERSVMKSKGLMMRTTRWRHKPAPLRTVTPLCINFECSSIKIWTQREILSQFLKKIEN